MRPLLALSLLVLAPALAAQDAPARLAFTTVGPGVTTGTPGAPYHTGLLSASLSHTRLRGWRAAHVGASVQQELLGNDGYGEVHIGVGAATSAGPLLVSATAGPSVGYGRRGVYGPGPANIDGEETTLWLHDREGLGVGVRATAQAVLVLVPELGIGIEATHDRNTLFPTSGVRLLLSLGTHRQSLVRL